MILLIRLSTTVAMLLQQAYSCIILIFYCLILISCFLLSFYVAVKLFLELPQKRAVISMKKVIYKIFHNNPTYNRNKQYLGILKQDQIYAISKNTFN